MHSASVSVSNSSLRDGEEDRSVSSSYFSNFNFHSLPKSLNQNIQCIKIWNMHTISLSKFSCNEIFSSTPSLTPQNCTRFPTPYPNNSPKFPPFSHPIIHSARKSFFLVSSKSSEAEEHSSPEDEWLKKLPDKKNPLYSHSLPCIEAWLRSLGFCQSKEDRAVWLVEKPDWHAQLSLDVTDLYIRLVFWKFSTLCFWTWVLSSYCFHESFFTWVLLNLSFSS